MDLSKVYLFLWAFSIHALKKPEWKQQKEKARILQKTSYTLAEVVTFCIALDVSGNHGYVMILYVETFCFSFPFYVVTACAQRWEMPPHGV